jgi:hypothetical protein
MVSVIWAQVPSSQVESAVTALRAEIASIFLTSCRALAAEIGGLAEGFLVEKDILTLGVRASKFLSSCVGSLREILQGSLQTCPWRSNALFGVGTTCYGFGGTASSVLTNLADRLFRRHRNFCGRRFAEIGGAGGYQVVGSWSLVRRVAVILAGPIHFVRMDRGRESTE